MIKLKRTSLVAANEMVELHFNVLDDEVVLGSSKARRRTDGSPEVFNPKYAEKCTPDQISVVLRACVLMLQKFDELMNAEELILGGD